MVLNLRFFIFCTKICNARKVLSNITMVFQITPKKYPNKEIFIVKFKVFCVARKLQLGKGDSADFKYDNSFLCF